MRCFLAALLLAVQGYCAADFINDDVLFLIHLHQKTDCLDTFITSLEAREPTTESEAVLLLARWWQEPSQDNRKMIRAQLTLWRKQAPESLTLAVIEAFLAYDYDNGGFGALDQVLGHWLSVQPSGVQAETLAAIDVYRQHWAQLTGETPAPFDPMDYYRKMARQSVLKAADSLEQQAGWIDTMLRNSPMVQAFGDPEVLQQDSTTKPLAERLRDNVQAYCQGHQDDCEEDNSESHSPSHGDFL